MALLKLEKKVPTFSLPDQDGSVVTHRSCLGRWTVLYFYPKDDTPGCTQEACLITEIYTDFTRKNVAVLGVSKDSARSHKKFATKYNLPFTLLSDPEMTFIKKCGAYVEKTMYGKPVRGTLRISYIINPEGVIAAVYPDVDPATHAHVLLKDITRLQREAKKAPPAAA